jgi:two-component system chemotaxis response regulator CheY
MEKVTQSHRALVLIVEDHVPTARFFAEIVQHRGALPIMAYDGQRALQLARSYPLSLVITDLMLPGMHGDKLIAALRKEWGATLPMILISAMPSSYLQQVGADALLAKPFPIANLEALLTRFLPL